MAPLQNPLPVSGFCFYLRIIYNPVTNLSEENKKNCRQTSLNDNKDIFNKRKNSMENNVINNNEITDEKIIENISNNSLIHYLYNNFNDK